MTTVKIAAIPSNDGKHKLHTVIWECSEPKAVLQIAHGMAEHIMRYDRFARWMNERNIIVAGNSHLGHGNTVNNEKELGYFARKNGWKHLVDDMNSVRNELEQRYPEIPYFILGHSMGSFLTRTYICTEYAEGLKGVILSGTGNVSGGVAGMLGAMASCIGLFCGKMHRSKLINNLSFGGYNKSFKPARTSYDWLTRDENEVDKYVADGRCGFIFTCSGYGDLAKGLKFIRKKKNLRKMNKDLPVLFVSGKDDPVGAQGKGVEQVYKMFGKVGVTNREIKLFESDRHEILNELDREDVYKKILEFVAKKIG